MKTVLCYGDSNTYGYDPSNGLRYPKTVRWPGVLQQLLGEEYEVIEEGCNGRTVCREDPWEEAVNGLAYLKPCLRSHKPLDTVLLMLGTNDLKECFRLSAREIAESVRILTVTAQTYLQKEQGYVPEIVIIAPPHVREGIQHTFFGDCFDDSAVLRSRELAGEYRRVAEETGCRFFDAASCAEASKEDFLHFAPESHRALAEALAKLLRAAE